MIELEMDARALEALLDYLALQPQPGLVNEAYKALREAHDNAAEEYWTGGVEWKLNTFSTSCKSCPARACLRPARRPSPMR